MAKEEKVAQVTRIGEKLALTPLTVFTNFQGLTASQITQLRRMLRETGGEYKVIKNTFLRFALERLGAADSAALLEGPTGVAYCAGDERVTAKGLQDFLRSTRIPLRIKGGILAGKVVTAADLSLLATLPPRGELVAKLSGQLRAPVASLLFVLGSSLSGLVLVLKGRMQQLEQEARNDQSGNN